MSRLHSKLGISVFCKKFSFFFPFPKVVCFISDYYLIELNSLNQYHRIVIIFHVSGPYIAGFPRVCVTEVFPLVIINRHYLDRRVSWHIRLENDRLHKVKQIPLLQATLIDPWITRKKMVTCCISKSSLSLKSCVFVSFCFYRMLIQVAWQMLEI